MSGQEANYKQSYFSDQAKFSEDGRNVAEICSQSKQEVTDSLLYDSGRTDSGFLSGANLHSDMITSEEIMPLSPFSSNIDNTDSKSYSRLDSGVDVGLSDQFSDICLDEPNSNHEDKTNIMLSQTNIEPEPMVTQPRNLKPPVDRYYIKKFFRQDMDGDTTLHMAIIMEKTEVAFKLINIVPHTRLLDILNDLWQTPLHLAALTKQPSVVRRLVCAGANPIKRDQNGNTPLHIAVENEDMESVLAILTPVSENERIAAQWRYDAPIEPSQPDMHNFEGEACVHLAAMRGANIPMLRVLVYHGADINLGEGLGGDTVLHQACKSRNEKLVLELLKNLKAKPSMTNFSGHTPYRYTNYHQGINKMLLAYGGEESSSSDEMDTDDEEDSDDHK